VTIHEFLHFAVARLLDVPANFLNLTAVGIPNVDVDKYPSLHLFLMNGIAPIFSMLVLGALGFLYCIRKTPQQQGHLYYFVAWITALNVPYLGLQMILSSTRVRFNGTGNDFAAVLGYFEISMNTRIALSVLGYIVFLCLLIPLKNFIFHSHDTITTVPERSIFKRISGASFLLIGFFSVCIGNWLLSDGNSLGMWLLMFGTLGSIAIAFAFLIPWRHEKVLSVSAKWLLPGIVGSLLLLPIGIIDGNDYAIYWLVVTPIALGTVYFSSRVPSVAS